MTLFLVNMEQTEKERRKDGHDYKSPPCARPLLFVSKYYFPMWAVCGLHTGILSIFSIMI